MLTKVLGVLNLLGALVVNFRLHDRLALAVWLMLMTMQHRSMDPHVMAAHPDLSSHVLKWLQEAARIVSFVLTQFSSTYTLLLMYEFTSNSNCSVSLYSCSCLSCRLQPRWY
jgi:hypothetical protein